MPFVSMQTLRRQFIRAQPLASLFLAVENNFWKPHTHLRSKRGDVQKGEERSLLFPEFRGYPMNLLNPDLSNLLRRGPSDLFLPLESTFQSRGESNLWRSATGHVFGPSVAMSSFV